MDAGNTKKFGIRHPFPGARGPRRMAATVGSPPRDRDRDHPGRRALPGVGLTFPERIGTFLGKDSRAGSTTRPEREGTDKDSQSEILLFSLSTIIVQTKIIEGSRRFAGPLFHAWFSFEFGKWSRRSWAVAKEAVPAGRSLSPESAKSLGWRGYPVAVSCVRAGPLCVA